MQDNSIIPIPASASAEATPEPAVNTAPVTPALHHENPAALPIYSRALYIGISAILLTLGVAAFSIYTWSGQRDLTHQIEQTVMALRDLDTSLKGELNQGLKEMRAEQQVLRDVTQEIRNTLARSHDYTVATEAEYLMRIALHRLQLEHDITSATAALEEADRRLQQIDDPILFETRRQLINEITALKFIPQADITGASVTLRSLENQIDQLALPTSPQASSDTTHAARDESFWGTAWRELKSLVVIRRTDQTTPPLAQPEQRFFLRHNLRLTLETAQLALLRRDNAAFRSNVSIARNWLGRYFEQNATTQLAQESLAKIEKINLTPTLPDTTGSLKSLQAWLNRNRSTLPLPPTLPSSPGTADSALPATPPGATAP